MTFFKITQVTFHQPRMHAMEKINIVNHWISFVYKTWQNSVRCALVKLPLCHAVLMVDKNSSKFWIGTSLNSEPLLCCRWYHRRDSSLKGEEVRKERALWALTTQTLYAGDKPSFLGAGRHESFLVCLRGITMAIYHSHRAQLLAPLLQHPLIFVFPGSVAWLNLSSKQQIVFCILMTWGIASGQKNKKSSPHAYPHLKAYGPQNALCSPSQDFDSK